MAQPSAGFSAIDNSLFDETLTGGELPGAAGGGGLGGNAAAAAAGGGSKKHRSHGLANATAAAYAPAEIGEDIKDHFCLDFEWGIPFPRIPKAPLMYVPEAVRDVFSFPPKDVQTADLDAMSTGMLEMIPVVPYLTRPDDIREMTNFVKACNDDWDAKIQHLKDQGINPSYLVDPREVNPTLTQKDYDLIDVDFHVDSINDRNLPSLALLQKPLYTEMNEVPREVRAAARVQRLQEQAGIKPEGSTPRRAGRGGTQGADGADGSASFVADTEKTFKNSNKLDKDFEEYLVAVGECKLGLVASASSDKTAKETHTLLVRLLFRHLAYLDKEQQKAVWHACCNIAAEKKKDISAKLLSAIPDAFTALVEAHNEEAQTTSDISKKVQQDEDFVDVMEKKLSRWCNFYGAAIKNIDVKKRLGSISHGTYDIAGSKESGFEPGKGVKRPTKLILPEANHNPVPLAVLPVFPSGFNADGAEDGELNPYEHFAAGGKGLSHLTLTNQKGSGAFTGEGATPMPYVVMETTRAGEKGVALLNPVHDIGAQEAPDAGATANYKLQVTDQFTPMIDETHNLGSYVMSIENDHVEYDRIGSRTIFIRNTSQRVFKSDGNFLVVWEDEKDTEYRQNWQSALPSPSARGSGRRSGLLNAGSPHSGEKRKANDDEDEIEVDDAMEELLQKKEKK